MPASCYPSTSPQPDLAQFKRDLAETALHLDEILSFVTLNYGSPTLEWKAYGKKAGWLLKVISQKRNLFFVIPQQGHFITVFTFGDKTVEQIFASPIAQAIKNELTTAKKYAEGRTIHVPIYSHTLIADLTELIRFKANG